MTVREDLYRQLPAVYRRRDAELGGPLRALLAIIDEQLQVVQADVETSYDNAFIETAEEWLVPYIGQALGLPVVRDVPAIAFSRRAFVANTIRYRRSKGTAATLELLARDLTNYPARVVELFARIAWNEAINHPAERPATLDLRTTTELERLGGPFESATRTAEVRRIASGRGLHNLPNVGLFLWRTRVWPLVGVNATSMAIAGVDAYRFCPLGVDRPLYAGLETETDPAALATVASVPLALSRRRLWQQAATLGDAMIWPFAIEVHGLDGAGQPVVRAVPPARIEICDLSAVVAPAPADRVEVDPQLGRLSLGADLTAGLTGVEVVTDHCVGTAGTLGAGPWDRNRAIQAWLDGWRGPPEGRTVGFQVMVARALTGTGIVATLDAAIQQWNAHLAGLADDAARGRALGLILVGDSRTHAATVRAIELPAGAALAVVAATWPETAGASPPRAAGQLAADTVRPIIDGDVRVRGLATSAGNRGQLLLDGLLITGTVIVENGALQGLRLQTCTVLGAPGVHVHTVGSANAELAVEVAQAIVGDVEAPGLIAGLTVDDTAVTGLIRAPEATARIDRSTVVGTTVLDRLDASSSIFVGRVTVERHQDGCVRFCYLPRGSRAPRRFRCQPDLADEAAVEAGGAAASALVLLRVRPRFVGTDPLAPGFLLLAADTAVEVRGAAEDGGEPGSWNHLQHGVRASNLRNTLPRFLRFGLEPGVFFLV